MAKVIYGTVKLKGSLPSGTGDALLTRDATSKEVGTVASALGSLNDSNIFVGNASNLPVGVAVSGDITMSNTGVVGIAPGVIVNADINAAAAIAYTKLNLSGAIVNADVNASAAIAYTKLNLTGSIVNADVNASAAIARSKFASGTANRVVINNGSGVMSDNADITANRALISDASGLPTHSTVTNTEIAFVSGVTSAIQTQLNTKLAATITSPAEGDILYFDGADWVNFARGADGEVLLSTTTSIAWGSVTANGLPVGGTAGQVLYKQSGTNFDADWENLQISDISGITASASQINVLATGFYDATSSVQTQIDGKLSTSLTTDNILKGVGGVATATTDLPTGITIGSQFIYRTNGTDVAVSDGGTGLSAIGARSVWVANSANTITTVTPGAGQSIRINAGNTAWEAYTPSSGGIGGSTGSTDNAIIRADGTGGSTVQSSSASIDDSGNISVASIQTSSGNASELEIVTGNTNLVQYPLRLDHQVTGTPAIGVGTGMVFQTETASGNSEIGATIEAVTTDVTSGSEDFDLVFKTMAAGGTASERFRYNTISGRFNVTGDIVGTGALVVTNGVNSSNGALSATINDGSTNGVTYLADLVHTTSGTPANGIGVGMRFQAETSAGNNEVGATIEALTTDVTSTSEDFDLVFKVMSAGAAAAEQLRIKSDTSTVFNGPSVLKSYTVAGVPTASSFTGGMIYVSDESGGAVPAFSDGTNWRRVTDRAIIS